MKLLRYLFSCFFFMYGISSPVQSYHDMVTMRASLNSFSGSFAPTTVAPTQVLTYAYSLAPQVCVASASHIANSSVVEKIGGVVQQILATFNTTDSGSHIISCTPLSIQDWERLSPQERFDSLMANGVDPDKICQLYTHCVSSTYRSLIEQLTCFEQVAFKMTEWAKLDQNLASSLRNTIFDNGSNALDYYNEKSLALQFIHGTFRNNGQTLTFEQIAQAERLKAIFTKEKITELEIALRQMQATVDPAQQDVQELRIKLLSDLEAFKAEKKSVSEVVYKLTPAAWSLAAKNQVAAYDLDSRIGCEAQHTLDKAIVEEVNTIAAIPVSHNKEWVAQFQKQMLQKLDNAMRNNEQGNLAQSFKEYADVRSLSLYVQKVASGSLNYQQVYGAQALINLKNDINARISELGKRLDPKFFTEDKNSKNILPPQFACENTCSRDCPDKIQHHEQRTLIRQINKLSECKNAVQNMMIYRDHTLTVTSYECKADTISNTPSSRIHVTGNLLHQELSKQAVELRNSIALWPAGHEKNVLLNLADSMINLAQSGNSPAALLDGMDVIALYQAWPTEYGTFTQGGALAPVRSEATRQLKLKIDEIGMEIKDLMQFRAGTVEGWMSRGASLADVLKDPHQASEQLQNKAIAIAQLLQKTTDAYSRQLDDSFRVMMAPTEQERTQAAERMLHRSERVSLWAMAVSKRLQAMSARDWGQVAGETVFDMCTFNLAGKAAGVIATGLKEARHAELALKCEKVVSQTLETVAHQINSTATELAGKITTALEPELAAAGTHIKETWSVLKQDAQKFVNNSGKAGQAVKQIRTFQDVIQKYFGSIKEIGKTKAKDIQHVLDRHIPGGKDVFLKKDTSLFIITHNNPINQAKEIAGYCAQAWKNGAIVKNEFGKIVKVFDCGKIIGLDKFGNPTSKIQIVIVEAAQRLISAYPVH